MFKWGTLKLAIIWTFQLKYSFGHLNYVFFANLNYYLAHLNNFCLIFNFFFGSFVELFNWAAVQYTIFGPPLISILYIFILYIISGLYTWVRLRHFLGRALWLGLARGPSLRPINMQDLALVIILLRVHHVKYIDKNFQRIFSRFLPVLYTGEIFKIVKSRFTTSITQGGYVNYQPVLHNANLVENLCFVCWES